MCGGTFVLLAVCAHVLFVAACCFIAHLYETSAADWSASLSHWDAAHYLKIATHGYLSNDPSTAFYPLYPIMMTLAAPICGGNLLIAGLVLSNIFQFLFVSVLYRLIAEQFGARSARMTIIALLSFPTAFFFSLIYTEALFVLEVSVFFFGIHRRRVDLVALAGFFLPMTRAVGVFAFPIALWHWDIYWRRSDLPAKRKAFVLLLTTGSILGGWLMYFFIVWLQTGRALSGFDAQQYYPHQPSLRNILDVCKWASVFLDAGSLHGALDSFLDRGCFVLVVCCLYFVGRHSPIYSIWTMFAGLVPAFSNCFFSYSRYVLALFPVFLAIARFGCRPVGFVFFCSFVFACICLQAVLIWRYVHGMWAG
jgi:hypothetical protein